MKCAQQQSFVTVFLALAYLTDIASSKDLSPLLKASSSVTKRNLEDNGDDFSFGQWAGNLLDSIVGSVGGNDDGETETDLDLDLDLGLCTFVEAAIGMGEGFGVTANCTCDGGWESGLELSCNFDECAPGSDVCGKVNMKFVFGGIDGPVDMTACADFENDQYQETCFSYQLEMDNGFQQTCQATYGGQPCDCAIESNLCLKADCSRFVPGATIDTCQYLSMTDAGDMQNFFPDFEIFQPDFQLQAENVPWETLDFENLDFDNFDVGALQWGDILNEETWMGLIGNNPTFEGAEGLSGGVCKLMYQAANLSQDLGMESSCECGYDETKGALELSCDFSETCTSKDDFLCGSVSTKLTYAGLTEIYTDVCIKYLEFPETCYSYGVPFAQVEGGDQLPGNKNDNNGLTPPSFFRDCSARYGGGDNNCKCTIDENSCLTVDCTDFEPLAITDECQVVDLKDIAEDTSKVVLNFRTPTEEDVVSDGAGGEFVALESSKNSGGAAGGASIAMATLIVAVAGQQFW